MTVLAFILALSVLITVHEWSHYRVAVALGVKVLTFSLGFGRPLLRWRSKRPYPGQDTEFVIGLIPLGGYVRMLDESDGDLSDTEASHAFNRQPLRSRAAIVLAGPLSNFLLAVALYAFVFAYGQYETKAVVATPKVGSVAYEAGVRSGDEVLRVGLAQDQLQIVRSIEHLRWWLLDLPPDTNSLWWEVQPLGSREKQILNLQFGSRLSAVANEATPQTPPIGQAIELSTLGIEGPWTAPVIGEMQTGKPAQLAGLARGDVVLRIDGKRIDDASMLRQTVRASGAMDFPKAQIWEVQRRLHGVLLIEVVPEQVKDGQGAMGRIGAYIGGVPATQWVQLSPIESVHQGLQRTWDMAAMTLQTLWRMLTGSASWRNLSGPLTMADYAGKTASLGLGAYLSYLAVLSVSLGVFNLLPLPMLDGGHLLYYLYEAVTGHPPSTSSMELMQRFGLVALMVLMTVSFFNDVVRLGWFN